MTNQRDPSQQQHHGHALLSRASYISLKTRLRWSYTLVSVLPMVILGLFLLNSRLQAQRENILSDQQTATRWVKREIDKYIRKIDRYLLDDIGPNVGPSRSEAEVRDTISTLIQRERDLFAISVITGDGMERVHISRLQSFHTTELVNRRDDPLFQQAMSGKIAYGPITRQNGGMLTYLSYAPIGTGSVVGVLRAEVNADPIQDALSASLLEEGSYTYLVDRQGALQLTGKVGPPPPAAPALAGLISAGRASDEYYSGVGTLVLGTMERLEASDWWVVVEIPRDLAYAPVDHDTQLLLLAVALVVITTIGWGLFQARRIVRPIEAVRAGAMVIGQGDLSYRIKTRLHDEIGELAHEFNRMAARLQSSHAQIESQNESLRKGLDLAREIQIGLLPDRVPWDAQLLTVYGRSIPAAEVGGDLYLFVDTRVQYRGAIAIGDISGKGIPAALMMALLSSAVEVQAREVERPAGLLTILNGQLSARLKANRMNAGLLYMLVDLEHAFLSVANAGMISPLLLRNGKVEFLEVYGLPLGSGIGRYTELKISLLPGDLVLLISDGVVEARNAAGELFGFERLEQTVNEHLSRSHPALLVDALIAQVETFMDGAPQPDDMTVVLIQPNLALVEQRFQRSEELLV